GREVGHGRDEPVAAPRQRLHESRLRRRVAERVANLRDAVVQAAIEIDEGVAAPDALLQFSARHYLARTLDQDAEHARRLRLQALRVAVAPQLARALIELEIAEVNHGSSPIPNAESRIPNPENPALPRRRALSVDVHRVERLARRHEQAIAFRSAEADVGAHFRQADAAEQLAVGRPHGDAAVADAAAGVA